METKASGKAAAIGEDLPPLTMMRIFAALWVVFSHHGMYWEWLQHPSMEVVRRIIGRGDLGVKLFFVLSGFILTHVYAGKDTINKREFFAARFARIYPLYLTALVIALPWLWFQIPADLATHGSTLGWTLIAAKSLSVLLLLQTWIPGFASHWNGVAWSLSAEAFFYTTFPFLLPRLKRFSFKALAIVFGLILVLEVFRFGQVEATGNHGGVTVWAFNPLLRLSDFVTGILIGILRLRGIQPSRLVALPAAALLLGGCALAPGYVAFEALMVHLGCAGLIWSLAFPCSVKTPITKVAVLLGQSSYATYLIHQSFGFSFSIASRKLFGFELPYLYYLAGLLFLSILLFTYIETPARMFIRQWVRKN